MKKIKFLLFILLLAATSCVASPVSSNAFTLDFNSALAVNIDPGMMIAGITNIDPKMLIPGDSSIDPKFLIPPGAKQK